MWPEEFSVSFCTSPCWSSFHHCCTHLLLPHSTSTCLQWLWSGNMSSSSSSLYPWSLSWGLHMSGPWLVTKWDSQVIFIVEWNNRAPNLCTFKTFASRGWGGCRMSVSIANFWSEVLAWHPSTTIWPNMQMLEHYLELGHDHFLSHTLKLIVTDHYVFRWYVLWGTERIVKYT